MLRDLADIISLAKDSWLAYYLRPFFFFFWHTVSSQSVAFPIFFFFCFNLKVWHIAPLRKSTAFSISWLTVQRRTGHICLLTLQLTLQKGRSARPCNSMTIWRIRRGSRERISCCSSWPMLTLADAGTYTAEIMHFGKLLCLCTFIFGKQLCVLITEYLKSTIQGLFLPDYQNLRSNITLITG